MKPVLPGGPKPCPGAAVATSGAPGEDAGRAGIGPERRCSGGQKSAAERERVSLISEIIYFIRFIISIRVYIKIL
jgi:hypothetical protein